ncbi:MAG: hypothetical protein JSV74_00020 [Dehalococcoidia bacterium]|nr:MAG: hypothetical protein JSV74_00020 [Dehalococcoidia bacterium]
MSHNAIISISLISVVVLITLIACSNDARPSNSVTVTTTSSTVVSSTTTNKPTGVAGSTLLPENAPEAAHYLGGGLCFQCHETPPGHTGEVLNQFGCDRCHVQTSTAIPETPITTISN